MTEYTSKFAVVNELKRFSGYLDDDMLTRLETAVSRLPTADVGPVRWIPVTERLPGDFQKVLVFWREQSEPMIDTAFWQKDAKQFDGEHWVRMEDKVTHWMPLPEPPKEVPGHE